MFPIRDHNPSGRTPYVTWALIGVNVAVFLATWGVMSDARTMGLFYYDWALIPARFSTGENMAAILTSMFLHGGLMHLGGNMLFLFIFGDNLEDEMGHLPYLGFYLASGLAAGLAQVLSAPFSAVPMVGASGAIAGVMGGYLLLFPRARVDILLILVIFFKVIPVPAWIVLGVWFALQIFGGAGAQATDGGVAYWAHAGGFLAGLALSLPVWSRRGGPNFWIRNHGRPPHPDARYRLSPTHIPSTRHRRRR